MSVATQTICPPDSAFFGTANFDLCEQLLPLVREIARKMHRQVPKHVELDDMISAGTVGLLKALERCKITCDAEFFAYVRQRVRGAILDSLRAEDWAPRSLRKRGRELRQATADLEGRGLSSSDEDLAAALGTSPKAVRQTLVDLDLATVGSLHEVAGEAADMLIDQIPDRQTENSLGVLLRQESRESVMQMLDTLTEREHMVLKLSFYEDLSLKEIGQVLSLTESRVSQIRTRALKQLRASFSTAKSY